MKEGLNTTNDELKRMCEMKSQGHCCSSIIVQLGLDLRGEENEQLVWAVRGLCNGLYSGLVCGALTGSVCMLALFDAKNTEMTKDMVEWFQSEYAPKYGSCNCEDITGDDQYKRTAICPDLIKDTYLHAKQLLIDFGYISNE